MPSKMTLSSTVSVKSDSDFRLASTGGRLTFYYFTAKCRF